MEYSEISEAWQEMNKKMRLMIGMECNGIISKYGSLKKATVIIIDKYGICRASVYNYLAEARSCGVRKLSKT